MTLTLRALAPGAEARVTALSGLESALRDRLMAYGLAPGRRVRVIQQRPLTVVRLGHTDLALEAHLALGIEVDLPAG